MANIKKRYIVLVIVSLLIFALLFSLSTLTKNWLVNNSEKLIKRKIAIGEIHLNYAKVAVQIKNFVMYEENRSDSFASFGEFYINLNPWELLSKEYSFSEIRLVQPKLQIVQNGEKFNFDTLIPAKDTVEKKDSTADKVTKFIIRNARMTNGELIYTDLQKKNEVHLKNLKLDLPMLAWDNKKSEMGVDFSIGEKGHVTLQAQLDNLNKKYQLDIQTDSVDINPITNYLTDYFDVTAVRGLLSSTIKITGDMNEIINISLSGKGDVYNFAAIDGSSEKILSSPHLTATISDVNLKKYHFGFGKIEVTEPNLLLVRNKDRINLEQFFAPYFRADSIISSTGNVSLGETSVTYNVDTILINNGLISIADNTLRRSFSYRLNALNMKMLGLSEKADRIPVSILTKLNDRGEFAGEIFWSMLDLRNFEMKAKVKKMDLISFSPYSEYFIASPITQGWLNYDLNLKMSPKIISNLNKIKVEELEFGKRIKDSAVVKVPVRLTLYIMKDVNDQINIDFNVEGNPSDPKVKLGKIFWKTLSNLMVKAAVSPFKSLSHLVGTNPESMEKLSFSFAQDSLDQEQRDKLAKLAGIMKKKPELNLIMTQNTDISQEKGRIAIQLTKKEFLTSQPADLSETLNKLKDDDPNLLSFISKSVPEIDSIGVEKACLKRLSPLLIEERFQSILNQRNRTVIDYFTINQGIPVESVRVTTADLKNLPLELKFPHYKIEVLIK